MVEETQCQRKQNGRGNTRLKRNTVVEETQWYRKRNGRGNTTVDETK